VYERIALFYHPELATRKNKKGNLQGVTNYYCPQCKKEQVISNAIDYDFSQGKNSHLGGTTLFVCTNCGSSMKPEEKEEI